MYYATSGVIDFQKFLSDSFIKIKCDTFCKKHSITRKRERKIRRI